jgi:ribosomal protein L24
MDDKTFSLTVHATNKAGKRIALGHKIQAASKEIAAVKAIGHHAMSGHKDIRVTHQELKEEKAVTGHKFSVTTTDPNHTAVSKRDYKRHNVIRVAEPDRGKAAERAKAFYKKQGLKVHDVYHHSEIKEEIEDIEELNTSTLQSYLEKANNKHKLVKVDGKKKVELLSPEKSKTRTTGINRAYDKVLNKGDFREEAEMFEGMSDFEHQQVTPERRRGAKEALERAQAHKAEAAKHPAGSKEHKKAMADHDDEMETHHYFNGMLKKTGHLKEDELVESRFDHREAAQRGIIHPHAFAGMKVGSYHDHYSTKNGDKLQFKVHKHTAGGVVLQAPKDAEKEHGKYHTYKISHTYGVNEDVSTHAADKKAVTVTLPDGSKKAEWRPRSTKDIAESIMDYTYDYGDHVKIQSGDHKGKTARVHTISPTGTHVGVDSAKTGKHLGYFHISDVKKHTIKEEEESMIIIIDEGAEEGHATKDGAEEAMKKHDKKHPSAKHTVMQGRRSGRWHVVRHTGGGMHVVEEVEELEEKAPASSDHHYIASLVHDLPNHDGTTAMNALPKEHKEKIKAFRKSAHWKAVDKKHTDPHTGEQHAGGHVDDDIHKAFHKWHKETYGTKHKPVIQESCNSEAPKKTWKAWLEGKGFPNQEKFEPKAVVKEGDESEAEYQEYLKSLKDKSKKKASIIKTIVKGK